MTYCCPKCGYTSTHLECFIRETNSTRHIFGPLTGEEIDASVNKLISLAQVKEDPPEQLPKEPTAPPWDYLSEPKKLYSTNQQSRIKQSLKTKGKKL